jgi:hypothetical protein
VLFLRKATNILAEEVMGSKLEKEGQPQQDPA